MQKSEKNKGKLREKNFTNIFVEHGLNISVGAQKTNSVHPQLSV